MVSSCAKTHRLGLARQQLFVEEIVDQALQLVGGRLAQPLARPGLLQPAHVAIADAHRLDRPWPRRSYYSARNSRRKRIAPTTAKCSSGSLSSVMRPTLQSCQPVDTAGAGLVFRCCVTLLAVRDDLRRQAWSASSIAGGYQRQNSSLSETGVTVQWLGPIYPCCCKSVATCSMQTRRLIPTPSLASNPAHLPTGQVDPTRRGPEHWRS